MPVALFLHGRGADAFTAPIRSARGTARRAVRTVLASGASIGLNTSYEAGGQPEQIAPERRALEQVAGAAIRQNRHHDLAARAGRRPSHCRRRDHLGLDAGFCRRGRVPVGVCHPVPLFDLAGNCPLGIEEHPLIVMDTTLSARSS